MVAKVVHTIKNNDYIYEHFRDKNQGGKVVSKYLGRADVLGAQREVQGEPRQIVVQPTEQPDVPQVNWNTSIHEGQIVFMSPEEYMERVNIFNRYSEQDVLTKETRAINSGLRGIGYYPPLSERSYISLMKAMRDGNAIDVPNLVYKDGYLENQEGFHRSLVARDLGIKEIPVHVIGTMPEKFKRAEDMRSNANIIMQRNAIAQLREKHLSKGTSGQIEQNEITETVEDARAIAQGIISGLGIEVIDTELIGSFRSKGFNAKDIDILVHINDITKLDGTKIISQKVNGKNLDVFVTDKEGKKGVFEDRGFNSYFRRI